MERNEHESYERELRSLERRVIVLETTFVTLTEQIKRVAQLVEDVAVIKNSVEHIEETRMNPNKLVIQIVGWGLAGLGGLISIFVTILLSS